MLIRTVVGLAGEPAVGSERAHAHIPPVASDLPGAGLVITPVLSLFPDRARPRLLTRVILSEAEESRSRAAKVLAVILSRWSS